MKFPLRFPCGRSALCALGTRRAPLLAISVLSLFPVLAMGREPAGQLRESVLSEATDWNFEQKGGDLNAGRGLQAWATDMAHRQADARKEPRNYGTALVRCDELMDEIRVRGGNGENVLPLVVELFNEESGLRTAHEALLERFTKVREKCLSDRLPEVFLERHDLAVAEHVSRFEELATLLGNLRVDVGDRRGREDALGLLDAYFEKFPAQPSQPISVATSPEPVLLENRMDVADLGLTAEGLPIPGFTGGVGPIPAANLMAPPAPADLAQNMEVRFTPEILGLVAELGNSPARIFDFVRNEIEYDPYVGSVRGAAETLRLAAGNDMDQASLLIAMLRAAGFPARYAEGTVEMTPTAALNWLGVADPVVAGTILASIGLEGVTLYNGPDITALRCRRIWVEAYVPYSDYRGAGSAGGEKMWVRLDPAFKPSQVYAGIDPVTDSGFDAGPFLDNYFTTLNPQSIVANFISAMDGYLGSLPEPTTVAQTQLRKQIVRQNLPWLPAGIPNKLLTRDGGFSEVPAIRRYSVRFLISGQGATLDHTVYLPQIAGKQVTLSYKGATPADVTLINANGGMLGISQPWMVQVVPELRVDGCLVATGTGSVTLGKKQDSQISFTEPRPTPQTQTIVNFLFAGNYEAHAIDTGRALVPAENPQLACPEDFQGTFLHRLGMRYLEFNDQADRELASVMQAVIWKSVNSCILSRQLDVVFSGSTPLTFEFDGLFVDADRGSAAALSIYGNDINYDYGRLRGAQSSQNENAVFEASLGKEAVSTIKILALAKFLQIPVFTINQSNASTFLPQLNHGSDVINRVIAKLNEGKVVIIPKSTISYFDWIGTGYIDYDPVNGRGGYIIQGGLAGGATAKNEEDGPECQKVTNIDISPPAPGNAYSNCDTRTVTITVTLTSYDKNCDASGTTVEKKQVVPAKLKPGVYPFKFGSTGDCGCAVDTVEITIKPGLVNYRDSQGRKSFDKRLEIIDGAEPIQATAPTGGAATEWAATGAITPGNQTGTSVTFSAPAPLSLPLIPLPNFIYLAPAKDNSVGSITATTLTPDCDTTTTIYSYPASPFEFTVDLTGAAKDKRAAAEADFNDTQAMIQDIVDMLDNVEDMLKAIREFSSLIGNPIQPPKFEKTGTIKISDVFVEDPKSHLVRYRGEIKANAGFQITGEIPVISLVYAGVPPALADAALVFTYSGSASAGIGVMAEYQREEGWTLPSYANAGFGGAIALGLKGKASVAAGLVEFAVSATAFAKLNAVATIKSDATKVFAELTAQAVLGEVEVGYNVGAGYGKWGAQQMWQVNPNPIKLPPDPVAPKIITLMGN